MGVAWNRCGLEAGVVKNRESRNTERFGASREGPPNSKGCLSILLALLLAALMFAGLYLLTSGSIIVAALTAGVIFGMAALQYILWGWWLSGIIRRQVEEEEREGP